MKIGLIALSGLWLAVVAASWANAVENNEYSFTWMDPEKKIYVLQNRKYLKTNRVFVSAMVGDGVSNAYRDTLNFDPRLAYYFSEAFGVELFYTLSSNSTSNTYQALLNTGANVKPVIRDVLSQYGALVHWVPWYAKINVFNQILYFDWYFAGGAGTLHTRIDTNTNTSGAANYVTEDVFGLFLGTGHQYHISQTLTVRLDYTGGFYRAPIYGNSGEKTWFSNNNYGIGLGIRF